MVYFVFLLLAPIQEKNQKIIEPNQLSNIIADVPISSVKKEKTKKTERRSSVPKKDIEKEKEKSCQLF
jgi:hypothetical protein